LPRPHRHRCGPCGAIPAVIAYNYYLSRLRLITIQVEDFGRELFDHFSRTHGDRAIAITGGLSREINVTPLVDVMMVLLVIFMVTAPMMQQGVDVRCPKPGARPCLRRADHRLRGSRRAHLHQQDAG